MLSAVVMIIKNSNNEILLLERRIDDRNKPGWCLPGGKVEDGESLSTAVLREVHEETNIKVKDFKYVKNTITDYKGKEIRVFVYSTTIKNPKVKISDEHIGFKWASLIKIDEMEVMGLMAGKTRSFI